MTLKDLRSGGDGVKENYYALTISLVRGCLPEVSFAMMAGQPIPKSETYATDMRSLKSIGMYWKDIGELFGVVGDTALRAAKKIS